MKSKCWFILAAAVIMNLSQPRVTCADAIFNVSVDTSLLSGVHGLYFQFTDGGDEGDAHNSATLNEFFFGGGSLSSEDPVVFGSVSGDIMSGLTLSDDGSFFSDFNQGFTPGSVLSFRLTLTTFLDDGPTPDTFAFSILGADGFPIPTDDPTGAGTLLTVYLNSTSPQIDNYGVTIASASVPEPGTLTLMGLALAGAASRRFYRGRKSRSALVPTRLAALSR